MNVGAKNQRRLYYYLYFDCCILPQILRVFTLSSINPCVIAHSNLRLLNKIPHISQSNALWLDVVSTYSSFSTQYQRTDRRLLFGNDAVKRILDIRAILMFCLMLHTHLLSISLRARNENVSIFTHAHRNKKHVRAISIRRLYAFD